MSFTYHFRVTPDKLSRWLDNKYFDYIGKVSEDYFDTDDNTLANNNYWLTRVEDDRGFFFSLKQGNCLLCESERITDLYELLPRLLTVSVKHINIFASFKGNLYRSLSIRCEVVKIADFYYMIGSTEDAHSAMLYKPAPSKIQCWMNLQYPLLEDSMIEKGYMTNLRFHPEQLVEKIDFATWVYKPPKLSDAELRELKKEASDNNINWDVDFIELCAERLRIHPREYLRQLIPE
jgi:hypothetical protein